MKFLDKLYYYCLIIVASLFLFNIILRDRILALIFETSSSESVSNANSYFHETEVRDFLINVMLGGLVLLLVASFFLLLTKKSTVNKTVLVGVIVLILIFFFGLISTFGLP